MTFKLCGAGPKMIERHVDMPPRSIGRGANVALGEPHAAHLGPDHRAIGDVEILQRRWRRVTRQLAVVVQKVVTTV